MGETGILGPLLLGFGCPEGVWVGSGVPEVLAAFVATLGRHRRRETAPSLAKNASVAMQQRPCTERARHLFSADRSVNFGGAEAGTI